VPTARASRRISAPAEELWELVCDPHHLPRWWPRVSSVEDVEGGAFTEVMRTANGKIVRADFSILSADAGAHRLTWRQRIEGTPFARLLSAAETELTLSEAASAEGGGAATDVTIEMRQKLTGLLPRLGGWMVRRAATDTIEGALDGLERISG
jgi:uncharacterized protein YndB with AHSA1/START domain